VNFGHLGAGDSRRRSLFLRNRNPVPVNVTVVGGSGLEGLRINLGRVGAEVSELLPIDETAGELIRLGGKVS